VAHLGTDAPAVSRRALLSRPTQNHPEDPWDEAEPPAIEDPDAEFASQAGRSSSHNAKSARPHTRTLSRTGDDDRAIVHATKRLDDQVAGLVELVTAEPGITNGIEAGLREMGFPLQRGDASPTTPGVTSEYPDSSMGGGATDSLLETTSTTDSLAGVIDLIPGTVIAQQEKPMTTPAWPPGLRPPDIVPHSWRCSRPPSEDLPITDQDRRPQIVKRRPGCKFGAVNPSVDGGRDIAGGVGRVAGGVGRGALQIGGTGLDSSDGNGHEDAEHHSGGRRSVRHRHLAWGRSVLLRIP
jgi:hypothetical protein